MGLIISPEPSIINGSGININISKEIDIESFAVTTNGIPPVIAKYIAYDNLTPKNPFIATVEDGFGNILMDGGFPKWYNGINDPTITTYTGLNPSFKYLYDAISFIENKNKVTAGNKKILILGDADIGESYCIKDSTNYSGFNATLQKIIGIKGYIPTYKTKSDYPNNLIDCTFNELDQYCAVILFSTVHTNLKLITDLAIQSLISYREQGNGIFIITDHGDNLNSIEMAQTGNYSGFFRTANFLITNFGSYFTGNFNRTPVNVGFLRTNYGNHILWENLSDSDEIYAGESESKVIITEYPLHTTSYNFSITTNGYHQIKILAKYTNGTLRLDTYTYGLNVPEIIYFQDENKIDYPGSEKRTFIRTHKANIKIDYPTDMSGILKQDSLPIGSFTFSKTLNNVTALFNSGFTSKLILTGSHFFYVQALSPLNYIKGFKIIFDLPEFNLRTSKVLIHINNNEFKIIESSSKFRNINKLLCKKNHLMGHFENRFKYFKIYEYFKNINQPTNDLTTYGSLPFSIKAILAKDEDFYIAYLKNSIAYFAKTRDFESFEEIVIDPTPLTKWRMYIYEANDSISLSSSTHNKEYFSQYLNTDLTINKNIAATMPKHTTEAGDNTSGICYFKNNYYLFNVRGSYFSGPTLDTMVRRTPFVYLPNFIGDSSLAYDVISCTNDATCLIVRIRVHHINSFLTSQERLYRTTDLNTWTNVFTHPNEFGKSCGLFYSSKYNRFTYTYISDDAEPKIIILKSTDGINWVLHNSFSFVNTTNRTIIFNKEEEKIFYIQPFSPTHSSELDIIDENGINRSELSARIMSYYKPSSAFFPDMSISDSKLFVHYQSKFMLLNLDE